MNSGRHNICGARPLGIHRDVDLPPILSLSQLDFQFQPHSPPSPLPSVSCKLFLDRDGTYLVIFVVILSQQLASSAPESSMRSGFPFLLCFLKRANFQPANLPTFFTYLFSSHALPHSFAFTKNATLLFSGNSKLFRKNTRGRGGAGSTALLGVPRSQSVRTKMKRKNDKSVVLSVRCVHRDSSGRQ